MRFWRGSILLCLYLAVLAGPGMGTLLHRAEHLLGGASAAGHDLLDPHEHSHGPNGHSHTHSGLVVGLLEQQSAAPISALEAEPSRPMSLAFSGHLSPTGPEGGQEPSPRGRLHEAAQQRTLRSPLTPPSPPPRFPVC